MTDIRLNQIVTLWSIVRAAHDETGAMALDARKALLQRYGGSVRRYLLGALRDPEAAEELAQDFACRFLQGELKGANPERGRFRDFVRGVLFHQIADHHNRKKKLPGNLPADLPELVDESTLDRQREEAFRQSWRDEMLARTWAALDQHEKTTGQPFHTVLMLRASRPELSSTQMAEELGLILGRTITAPGVRKTLERARERFADLLLEEIAHSLPDPALDRVEEELAELGLLEHCKEALERRR